LSQPPTPDTAVSVQQALVTMADKIATEEARITPLRAVLDGVDAAFDRWEDAVPPRRAHAGRRKERRIAMRIASLGSALALGFGLLLPPDRPRRLPACCRNRSD